MIDRHKYSSCTIQIPNCIYAYEKTGVLRLANRSIAKYGQSIPQYCTSKGLFTHIESA